MTPSVIQLKILKAGLYSTIQDNGRHGYRYYAIPTSGYTDQQAAQLANQLVENPIDAGLIEFNINGGTIKFITNATIALTGADMQWSLDNISIDRNQKISVIRGQILTGTHSVSGARAYLAINGIVDSDEHYGSKSTYNYAKLGGIQGSAIRKDQVITFNTLKTASSHENLEIKIIDYRSIQEIEIEKGPEWSIFSAVQQNSFLNNTYKISSDSNRMGSKLLPSLVIKNELNLHKSNCISAGIIQLPPAGHPIVIMQDGQTTGGYPRIAYIPRHQLNLFAQLSVGQEFRLRLSAQRS